MDKKAAAGATEAADQGERGRTKDRKKHRKHKHKSKDGKKKRSQSRGRSRSKSKRSGSRHSRSRSGSATGSRGRSRDRSSDSRGRSRGARSVSSSASRRSDASSGSSRGSKKRLSKQKKGKDSPADWSREELLEKLQKLAVFKLDKVTGSGLFECVNKRLLNDDIILYQECMRRFNEVQKITFRKCFLTDEVLVELLSGMKMLRHLRYLDLSSNLLTRTSVQLIISAFANASRRLESLDLRLNNLNEEDGITLYRSFSSIAFINGIPIQDTRGGLNSRSLELNDRYLKACEIGILITLLPEVKQIGRLNLASNLIDSRACVVLFDAIWKYSQIHSVNVSFNPLTYPDNPVPTLTGLHALVTACKQKKHIHEIIIDGVRVPEALMAKITISTMVNRSTSATGNRFSEFAQEQITAHAPPERTVPKTDLKEGFTIDYVFCKLNKIPEKYVEMQGDEIILKRKVVYGRKDDTRIL